MLRWRGVGVGVALWRCVALRYVALCCVALVWSCFAWRGWRGFIVWHGCTCYGMAWSGVALICIVSHRVACSFGVLRGVSWLCGCVALRGVGVELLCLAWLHCVTWMYVVWHGMEWSGFDLHCEP